MYGKEEAKLLRKEFWTRFGQMSGAKRMGEKRPRKWVTYNTGIPAVALKFDMGRKSAIVAIDIDGRNSKEHELYYNKFVSLKKIIVDLFPDEVIWDECYEVDENKFISRIYVEKQEVSIYNKDTWSKTFTFFYKKMVKFEDFFLEYKDFIKEE